MLYLKSSCVLWNSLVRCWHPSVHTTSVSDKFLRFTLQLVARYRWWVNAGLATRKGGSGGGGGGGGEWGLTASSEEFVVLHHDLEAVATAMEGPLLVGLLPERLGPAVPGEVKEMVVGSVRESAGGLRGLGAGVAGVVVDVVADKCCEVLRQLNGITATYRMTNKPLPTRHSHYTAAILQPLQAFLEGSRAAVITEEVRTEVIARVTEKVTTRFDDMARDLVTRVRGMGEGKWEGERGKEEGGRRRSEGEGLDGKGWVEGDAHSRPGWAIAGQENGDVYCSLGFKIEARDSRIGRSDNIRYREDHCSIVSRCASKEGKNYLSLNPLTPRVVLLCAGAWATNG